MVEAFLSALLIIALIFLIIGMYSARRWLIRLFAKICRTGDLTEAVHPAQRSEIVQGSFLPISSDHRQARFPP